MGSKLGEEEGPPRTSAEPSPLQQRIQTHFLRLSGPRTSSESSGILTMWKSCERRAARTISLQRRLVGRPSCTTHLSIKIVSLLEVPLLLRPPDLAVLAVGVLGGGGGESAIAEMGRARGDLPESGNRSWLTQMQCTSIS